MKNKKYENCNEGLIKGTSCYLIICTVLLIILILSILISVTIGTVKISINEVYRIIIYELFSIGDPSVLKEGAFHDIVWIVRFPRIILGLCVGMGLSLCGIVMQAIIKNSLADPYILGISSGASLGATLSIMLGIGTVFGKDYVGVCGFIGALAISILVLVLANVNGRANSTKLLLAGLALSTVCSAFSSFIVFISKNKYGIKTITYWLMGSLGGANWETNKILLIIVVVSVIFFSTQYRNLNLMLLGDDVSITLGMDLHKHRQIYLIVVSIIIGFLVYSSGIIGFVGLIIPHIARMIFGTNHKKIIIPSVFIGAIFIIWSDVISRIIIPGSELPIGILISIIGAPSFIYLMVKKPYGFGGGN